MIDKGNIICDKCNGSGKEESQIITKENEEIIKVDSYPVACSKCNGTGELTWIENVFGKSPIGYNHPIGTLLPFVNYSNNGSSEYIIKIKVDHMTWIEANGCELNKDQYPEIFNVINYKYGGNGNIFSLPDYRSKFKMNSSKEKTIHTLNKNMNHNHSL